MKSHSYLVRPRIERFLVFRLLNYESLQQHIHNIAFDLTYSGALHHHLPLSLVLYIKLHWEMKEIQLQSTYTYLLYFILLLLHFIYFQTEHAADVNVSYCAYATPAFLVEIYLHQ